MASSPAFLSKKDTLSTHFALIYILRKYDNFLSLNGSNFSYLCLPPKFFCFEVKVVGNKRV